MIPAGIIKTILEGRFIDTAVNAPVENSPMEYLFDVYEEFVDRSGEFENWNCFKCREQILINFRNMTPYLQEQIKEM